MSRSRSWLVIPLVILSLFALVALSTGCSSTGSTTAPATSTADDSAMLQGKTWQATMIAGDTSLVPGVEVTAKFEAGRISGNSSVNTYQGPYTTSPGNTIAIGQLSSTLMAGPEAAMKQEQSYIAALSQATQYVVTADSLTLKDKTGATLVAYKAVTPTSLKGTQWQAVAYNNGKGALQSLAAESTITAIFAEDGNLGGNASVNTYQTTYKTSGTDQMTIDGAIVTTKMAGPDDLMAQEAAYLAALPKTATYTVEGDELVLRDASGAALAQYRAK